MSSLVAVDLGLRSGLAVYGDDGKLRAFRSVHFASMAALKRGVFGLLQQAEGLEWVVVEGDRRMGDVWASAAEKQGARTQRVSPETWRAQLLLAREMRSGALAKEHADTLARRVVEWSGARRPTSLSPDVAEAILIGLWGVIHAGWLHVPPHWRP